MKKPAKPASKKAVPAKKAAPAKKATKVVAKSAAKPAPKPAAKKVVAKLVAKKPVVKATVKAKAPQKNIQKKIHDKIAASKKAVANKAVKKEAAIKKGLVKKPAPMKVKAPAKVELKTTKKAEAVKMTSKKEAPKAAPVKLEAKPAKKVVPEKPAKKLTKKEEKELLKAKGKKGGSSFEEEQEEEANKKPREEDEGDDDFETGAPKKVKMTFDEDIEEEIIPVRKKNKSGLDDDIKENLAEEILALAEDFSIDEVFASIRSMELFKIDTDECVVRGCDNPSTTSGYCRYHYIKLWKDVKKKELILSEGRLAKIIEELVRKYPMKYIETIIHDLADDKAFNHVLKDLDIETDENEIDAFDDEEALDDDQDIAFETKVVKPSFDD
ncbi:MAG: hypothetical protein H7281_03475 [Bacteriovorax sp.]|nr:hypothetical protein [Bacteriovorax sp.]